ncbi:MAG: sterol desaturase family protein [Deltaproteobacteria bacterium]|nr:sterol desaturase family protein [Deltaproteobacteria bacterium]
MMEGSATTAISIANMVSILFVGFLVCGMAEVAYVHKRLHAAKLDEYRMMGKGLGALTLAFALVMLLLGPFNTAIVALWVAPHAPVHAGYSPMGWIYGLIVYELAYWIHHWLGHKVRLFWCVHSPHHAPESMSLFVGFNHFFFESTFYAPVIIGLFSGLLGVHPVVVAGISILDMSWGNSLHVSNHVVVRRYGFLERFMQTPSYHRVHHAQNIRYMDMNYNSITLLWDWIFGTLQPLDDAEPVIYGITRDVDTSSFWDVHFGEFRLLWRDMRRAPSLRAAISYLVMPPGWSHTGHQQTVAELKAQLSVAADGTVESP